MDIGYYKTRTGVNRRVISTKGWKLKVKWNSVETSYIYLNDIKETKLVETTEYAKVNKIDKEP